MHVGILGTLFSFVGGVNQKIEPMGIWIVFYNRQQVPFVEDDDVMHSFGKLVQQPLTLLAKDASLYS